MGDLNLGRTYFITAVILSGFVMFAIQMMCRASEAERRNVSANVVTRVTVFLKQSLSIS